MRYDLDAEHMNAGFWPGDDNSPIAGFYGYLVPRPAGCDTAPIEPEHAGWVEAMGEWMMPYEAVRTCDEPRAGDPRLPPQRLPCRRDAGRLGR